MPTFSEIEDPGKYRLLGDPATADNQMWAWDLPAPAGEEHIVYWVHCDETDEKGQLHLSKVPTPRMRRNRDYPTLWEEQVALGNVAKVADILPERGLYTWRVNTDKGEVLLKVMHGAGWNNRVLHSSRHYRNRNA